MRKDFADKLLDGVVAQLQSSKILRPFTPWLSSTSPFTKDGSMPTYNDGRPIWYVDCGYESILGPWQQFVPRPGWAQPVMLKADVTLCEYRPPQYVGDLPYSESTPDVRDPRRLPASHRLPRNIREQIYQKTTSVRLAVKAYVPPEVFTEYLFKYWLTNYGLRFEAFDQILGNILEQFNLCRPGRSAPNAMVRRCLEHAKQTRSIRFTADKGEEGAPQELARTALLLSQTRRCAASHFSKLMLAIALYQGGIRAYLDDLRAAVERSDILEADERRVALLVVRESLTTLAASAMFGIFQPIVILNHQERFSGSPTLESMQAAIRLAWEDLFQANLLRTELGEDHVVCAGNHHLRFLKDAKVIERLYGFAVGHKEDLSLLKLQADVTYAASQALQYPAYYYKYFLEGKPKLEAVAALKNRMANGL